MLELKKNICSKLEFSISPQGGNFLFYINQKKILQENSKI